MNLLTRARVWYLFLDILYEFAKKILIPEDYELFQQSIRILVIEPDNIDQVVKTKLKFDDKEIIIQNMILEIETGIIFVDLANGDDKGEFSDRLVPSYRLLDWEASCPDPIDLSTPYLCEILSMFQNYINHRTSTERSEDMALANIDDIYDMAPGSLESFDFEPLPSIGDGTIELPSTFW